MSLLLILNIYNGRRSVVSVADIQHFTPFSSVFAVDFEQVSVGWLCSNFQNRNPRLMC